MNKAQQAFYRKYYATLIGGTIVQTGVTDDGWPQLVVKMPTGETYTCEVSQDPEGNGPGFLFGLPEPR